MHRIFFAAVLSATVITSAPISTAADIKTLIQQKIDDNIKGPIAPKTIPYTYVVTADVTSGEGDKAESFIAKYQVNPGAAPGSRLTFIGDALETFPKEFQKQMERLETDASEADIASEFWCAGDSDDDDEPDLTPDDVTVISETETQAVIAISSNTLENMMQIDDGDGGGDMPKKVLKRLEAELTIAKPDLTLRQMKVRLSKPTTIKIVAKLKEMNIEQSCEMAANGIPYVTSRKMYVRGKALGSSFMEDTVITVSNLQPF